MIDWIVRQVRRYIANLPRPYEPLFDEGDIITMQSLRPRIATLDQRTATAPRTERIRGRRGVEIRRRNLDRDPLCAHCQERGIIRLATEVDHVIPLEQHGPDTDDNKQNLCAEHHRIKSAKDAGKRPKVQIGTDGYPVER